MSGILPVSAMLPMLSPVLGNVFIPSFVQFLTGPLLWSLYVITVVVTIPIILAIGLIEALVLRRYVQGLQLWPLTCHLAIINAFTSLIGTYFTWPGTSLWPGLVLAYLLTVPIEALLIRLWNRGVSRGLSLTTFLKGSAQMNAASYGVLALALIGLIHIPAIGHESKRVAREARGTLIVFDVRGVEVVDLWQGRLFPAGRRGSGPDDLSPALDGVFVRSEMLSSVHQVREHVFSDGAWHVKQTKLSNVTDGAIAVSPSMRSLLRKSGKMWGVFDVASGRRIVALPAAVGSPRWAAFSYDDRFLVCAARWFETPWLIDLQTQTARALPGAKVARFCPKRPQLAWVGADGITLYDCLSGQCHALHVPGSIVDRTSVAWSPDGRHIAYIGNVNPFTKQRWAPDVRIVSADGRESATVYRNLQTSDRVAHLFWTQ